MRSLVLLALVLAACSRPDPAPATPATPAAAAPEPVTPEPPSCAMVIDHMTELAKATPQFQSGPPEQQARVLEHLASARAGSIAECEHGEPAMSSEQRTCLFAAQDVAATSACQPAP